MNNLIDQFHDFFDFTSSVSFLSSVMELVPDEWKLIITFAVVIMVIVTLIKILIELL